MSGTTQPLSDDFKKAVADSKLLKAKPSDTELLELYGLYKQGTQDPPIEETGEPGMFDFKVPHPSLSCDELLLTVEIPKPKGKAKKKAWKALVDEGVTPEQAQARYVALVEKLKETYGYDPDKEPEAVGSGP